MHSAKVYFPFKQNKDNIILFVATRKSVGLIQVQVGTMTKLFKLININRKND